MSCKVGNALTYSGNTVDIWLNWTGLAVCTAGVAVVLRPSRAHARRMATLAPLSWVPLTAGLFALQLGADCATDNEGISAVWCAQAGWLATGTRTMPALFKPRAARRATAASLALSLGLTIYYAVTAEALSTVAHLVAFAVGAALAVVHKRVFQIGAAAGEQVPWQREPLLPAAGTGDSAPDPDAPASSVTV